MVERWRQIIRARWQPPEHARAPGRIDLTSRSRVPRYRFVVLGTSAIALAAALTITALIAPDRPARINAAYRPNDPDLVVTRVPRRDPEELAAKRALAKTPDDLEAAVLLARREIERARELSDPRWLGRAQATLTPWWSMPEPPPEVLLLRATIRQALHAFAAARADLDQLIRRRPDDAQAHLTRAVVATVTGDLAAARASCDAIRALASALVATACRAPLDALAGRAAPAYTELANELARSDARDAGIRAWALTVLAELAIQQGENRAAAEHLERVLVMDPNDSYARGLLADVLLEEAAPAHASTLLAGREQIDSLLVRRAIAEHASGGPEAASLVTQMRERIAAGAARGDRIHLREEARFALAVERDPARAVALARENWGVQQELADARLLAEAAVAANDRAAARTIIAWATRTGVRDVQLDRSLHRLGARRGSYAS